MVCCSSLWWHSHSCLHIPSLCQSPVCVCACVCACMWGLHPIPPLKEPPVFPCNEDILPVGRLMADIERYLTIPKPHDSSGNFTQNLSLFLSLVGESIHCVNESGKSNSKRQWDLRWGANCTKVMLNWSRDPWGKKKLPCSNTIEDIAVIFAVSRVFIIDFPLWHNGWAIMKSLSFLSFCDVRWWGHWLKVAEAMDCIVHAGNGQRLRTYEQSILGSTVHSKETRTYNKHCCIVTLFCICEFTAFSEIQFVFF